MGGRMGMDSADFRMLWIGGWAESCEYILRQSAFWRAVGMTAL